MVAKREPNEAKKNEILNSLKFIRNTFNILYTCQLNILYIRTIYTEVTVDEMLQLSLSLQGYLLHSSMK